MQLPCENTYLSINKVENRALLFQLYYDSAGYVSTLMCEQFQV